MKIEDFKNRVVPMSSKLFRIAQRLLNNIEEAEDMVQEVMLSLWSNKNKLGSIFNIDAYAHRVLKNKCLDHLKSHKVSKTDRVLEEEIGTFENLSKEMDEVEITSIIDKIINSLPNTQKLIVQMRDVEGYEIIEIAEIMEMEKNAVRTNLSRARLKVREALTKIEGYGSN